MSLSSIKTKIVTTKDRLVEAVTDPAFIPCAALGVFSVGIGAVAMHSRMTDVYELIPKNNLELLYKEMERRPNSLSVVDLFSGDKTFVIMTEETMDRLHANQK